MALGEENSGGGIPATMLVGPASVGNGGYPYPVYMNSGMGGGGGGGMFGGQDGAWAIILLIIILVAAGGWGNNGNGGGGGFGGGAPIIVNDGGGSGGAVQRGFDQAATMAGLSGIQNGIANLSTQLCGCCGDISAQLCNGFSGVNTTITGGVNTLAQQMYTNTIADLERSYAAQTASMQGMNGIQAQLAQCCSDNRLATESLRATVLSENCADRYEAANNTRDIIDAIRGGNQTILDKLCQLELDGVKQNYENRILTLQNALDQSRSDNQGLRFTASQVAQTAQIRDGQIAATNALVSELRACPIPSQPVYGNTPIFVCPQQANPNNNNGCGCGFAA